MKTFAFLAAVSALTSQVSAHYIFQQITYGGTKYPVYQYIRKNTNYNSPITDVTSNDLRCNEGGAPGTAAGGTLSVTAGSSFTITADTPVYHNGPIAMYMAKAPTTADAFDGSGQVWFKIWQQGPSGNTWPLSLTYTATFPAGLPNGEYLLRTEQLGLHNPYPAALPQFYVGCTQVSVTGGGSGTPGPLVSIPGHVKGTEPGYTVNIYNNFNPSTYQFLGPSVWTGGNGGGTTNPTTSAAGPQPTTTLRTTTRAAAQTTTTTTRAAQTTTSSAPSTGGAPLYGQCGGAGWTGPKTCATGTCKSNGDYYSQCVPA
jgi:hypothetical protein